MRSLKTHFLGATLGLACALFLPACGDSDPLPAIHPGAGIVVNRTDQRLQIGEVQSLSGTYGPDCSGRAEGAEWSLGTSPNATLPHPALSLESAVSSTCTIVLTQVAAVKNGVPVVYTASPRVALAGNGAWGPVQMFTGGTQNFFASARLVWSGAPFQSAFTVEFQFSDDPAFVPGQEVPVSPVAPNVNGTLQVSQVGSPNYVFERGTLSVHVRGTAISSVTGTSTLNPPTEGARPGTHYKIVARPSTGVPPVGQAPSIEAIDAAYGAETGMAIPAERTIPAAAFDVVLGDTLSQDIVLWLIVANVAETGVRAYQVIELTFPALVDNDDDSDA